MKTCDVCGVSSEDVETVCVWPATMDEPADYQDRCPKDLPKRTWLREKRAQARGEE